MTGEGPGNYLSNLAHTYFFYHFYQKMLIYGHQSRLVQKFGSKVIQGVSRGQKWSIASHCFHLLEYFTWGIISRLQLNVPRVIARFYEVLHFGPKAQVNLVPHIQTLLPRALATRAICAVALGSRSTVSIFDIPSLVLSETKQWFMVAQGGIYLYTATPNNHDPNRLNNDKAKKYHTKNHSVE